MCFEVEYTIFNKAQRFIEEGQTEQESYKNKKAQKRNIRVGDRVYILKKAGKNKLKNSYSGPWRVERASGDSICKKHSKRREIESPF